MGLIPSAPGVYANAVHFAALSQRGKLRSGLAMLDGGELMAEIKGLDSQAQQARDRCPDGSPRVALAEAVAILKLKIAACGQNPVYRKNCRAAIRALQTVLREGLPAPAPLPGALGDNRRLLARLDTPALIARLQAMDAALSGDMASSAPAIGPERFWDGLNYLLNRVARPGTPHRDFWATVSLVEKCSLQLPPALEDKYVRMLARRFL